uniref:Uncharacterized protein n=1 Tax=Nymphaea colorata TaxID=210225 RepID=A0A5K1H5M2_9MAGN
MTQSSLNAPSPLPCTTLVGMKPSSSPPEVGKEQLSRGWLRRLKQSLMEFARRYKMAPARIEANTMPKYTPKRGRGK